MAHYAEVVVQSVFVAHGVAILAAFFVHFNSDTLKRETKIDKGIYTNLKTD